MGRGRRVSAGAPHVFKPRPPGGGRVVTLDCGGSYMGTGMDTAWCLVRPWRRLRVQ